jgi:mannose-6-phosphate isomerase-like protein (cupin superfamily)
MPKEIAMALPKNPAARAADWLKTPEVFHGEWQGDGHGAGICVIVNHIERIGAGPRLHTHPYAETFVIRSGRARFTLGETTIEAGAGDILVAPAGTPHKFENLGPDPLETIDIHENGSFITNWLE